MSESIVHMHGVSRRFPWFELSDIGFELAPGQIMGFVGPNGAGKSTTLRILMGLLQPDRGTVQVFGLPMPQRQVEVKREIGYVSEDMRLHGHATVGWHLSFVASLFPGRWDPKYAEKLLHRFNLKPQQRVGQLSHGERMKAVVLLALARRPRLLVLDEPTTGFDPVARHELLTELMDVLADERRAIIFSSQTTQDVEQISDQITFIDRGRIIESRDKETFLDRWRRIHIDVPPSSRLPAIPEVMDVKSSGRACVVTTDAYTSDLPSRFEQAGVVVREVQRMTLEEIFVANVMKSRKEQAA